MWLLERNEVVMICKKQIDELRNVRLGINYLLQLIILHIKYDMKKLINPKFSFIQ